MNAPIRHADLEALVTALIAYGNGHRNIEGLVPQATATGIGEGQASIGGFLVPETVASEIWMRIYATGRIIRHCAPQPITRRAGVKVPAISETSRVDGSRFGGVRSWWVDEGQAPTASKPKFDQVGLLLKKLLTIIYATDELTEDVPALSAFLERVMSLEMQFTIEDKIINGTGAGVPLGVLNSRALIVVPAEGAQASQSVLYANLAKMVGRLWPASFATAVWVMNSDVFNLLLQMTNAAGAPVVVADAAGVMRLLTIPVEVCEYNPTIGNIGDIMLCDFGQYLLSQASDPIERSIHVQYVTDETAFKLRYRVDGSPAWMTPVTPRNATLTQSPFIALGARP
ncbi:MULTISPECIES: phage major capsid protein [Bradyrhizobium]|uniref:phage major capsid protein n=1 Tax=Bradyrhizobium TaxID=374 RepID=UPI0004B4B9C4|nr:MULTISPECIES: phage major capsid protein [Bradyrhizobium]MBR0946411.1 phage major capsid protein [Bradyrhizobium liaoningense]MBR1030094.1 phage major capsid protein [Bradyrhizobium liaoningense]MDI2074515.1 phage major capsid protein [Bradyrhizobium sp. Mp27]